MLDLIISYINFLILSISYIVQKFAYLPPDPPKYKIIKEKKEINGKIKEKEEIYFLMKSEKNNVTYKKLRPKCLNISFYQIVKDNTRLPILILTPIFHQPICIIYCQGNSGDLGVSLFECFDISLRTNCVIVTFEYPGYGICKNDEIKESEFYRRIKIVYEYITKILSFKPNQILLYGFSMGTGIAFDLACKKEYPVAGLILQSPFLSILRTTYNIKETKYFDLFNNCDKAKYLCRKTLFLHGDNDSIVPYIHGRILANLIPQKYLYDFLTVHKADHNNLIKLNKDLAFEYINQFISDCTDKSTITDYSDENRSSIPTTIIENNYDKRKISDLVSLKSEEFGFNKSDEIRKKEPSFQDEENYEKNFKAYSTINNPIINNINKNGNNEINKNQNQNEKVFINSNYNNYKENVSYNVIVKNRKDSENQYIKPKFLNNNYYYVNLGTNTKYNSNAIYRKPNKNLNNNNNINNLKNSVVENSIITMNSSTNYITNSFNN